jgi:hypothetical protein
MVAMQAIEYHTKVIEILVYFNFALFALPLKLPQFLKLLLILTDIQIDDLPITGNKKTSARSRDFPLGLVTMGN